jgi:hypothetical protein
MSDFRFTAWDVTGQDGQPQPFEGEVWAIHDEQMGGHVAYVGDGILAESIAELLERFRDDLDDDEDDFAATPPSREHEVYAKCKHCHLFVDENDGHGEGVAKYIHLHRGDDADEAIDASHEPEPGETATLAWWRINGPAEMRARFTNTDKEN